jgi:glycosyltransferase involved in cell wall biosynthesis
MYMLEAPGPAFVERTIGNALRERVSAIVASEDIGLVHVWSPGMAGSLRSFATRPKLLTLGDSFSLLHSTYSDSKPFPRSIYHSRAARGYAVYEASMIKAYDQVVVFNNRDRLQLEKMGGDRLAVIPNGVAPVRICPSSRLPGRAVLAFHGNYSHFPNLQAARFLIGEFRAALTEKLGESGVVLRLAGEDKGGIVRRLTEHTPCTEYVGYIDDLGAFMGEADVYCAPIFSGAGIKNKVLDAFSAGVPIVATPEAVEGVPIRDGEHCVVASRASFADAVARLLSNSTLRAQLASNGRALAGQFSWSSVASKYLELYRGLTGTI